MNIRRILVLSGILAAELWVAGGCTNSDQITDPGQRFETLTVAYGDPGPNAGPCDDVLPQIDGVPEDREWNLAKPLFVRMSGTNGNGGADYFLEVRAVWTMGETSRIYFLVRYADNDMNAQPDELAYMRPADPGEICDQEIVLNGVRYCASPPPIYDPTRTPRLDPVILTPSSWTRLNPGGKEDQVMLIFRQEPNAEAASHLIETDRKLLGAVGPETPADLTIPEASNTDVWIWRAGRTNLHPVAQFPYPNYDKSTDETADPTIPVSQYGKFPNTCGYAEDLWIDGSGLVKDDLGPLPFVKNFGRVDVGSGQPLPNVPIRLTQCPIAGKGGESDLAALNGGIPKDLGLWWPSGKNFRDSDTLACSRISSPRKWSTSLLSGEYDKVQGWCLQAPYDYQANHRTSSGDVRAKGAFEATQEKGFSVWSIEFMRDLDTGYPDDVVIRPDETTAEIRMVIGVLDASGKVGSGSTEIRLKFEAPKPSQGVVGRC